MKYFRKHTLTLFVLLAAVISPVGVKTAYALEFFGLDLLSIAGESFAYAVAMLIQYAIYIPSGWILRAAAFVFDTIVPYSLGIALPGHSAFQSAFITEGWGLTRDITNMLFIFAMLYIAIATILQLGAGRNTKALIVNIITVALFVNFSLFLAQVVIDGANLLAIEFYKALSASPHGLAAIFLTGFNPQQLLGTASFNDWITANNQSNAVLVVLYLFGGVVQMVAAYLIFWASFLFLGRIVVLWILMILSPLAFAAYIIPKTQHWFHEWWERLLNQAFVAPIFLFFFFIFALFLQGGLTTFLNDTAHATAEGGVIEAILKVSLGFSFVVAFLVVALKMTKKLGGEAAAWATNISGTAIGFAAGGIGGAVLGAGGGKRVAQLASMIPGVGGVVGKTLLDAGERAGRVVGVPLAPLRGVAGEVAGKAAGTAREVAGKAAKKTVELGAKPGLGGALLRGFGVARGAGRLEAAAKAGSKADIEKAEKDFEGLSENALQTEYNYATTTVEKRAAIIKILGNKKKLKPNEKGEWLIDPESIKETLKTVKERGYDTGKEVDDKYAWQYAENAQARIQALKKLNPENIKELGDEYFKDKAVLNAMFKSFGARHMEEVLKLEKKEVKEKDENGVEKPVIKDYAKEFFEALKEVVGEDKTLPEYFRDVAENKNAENWSRGPAGRRIARTYNISFEEERPKEEQKKKGEEEQAKKEKDEKFYQNFFGAGN